MVSAMEDMGVVKTVFVLRFCMCVHALYVWRNCASALLFCIAASSGRECDRWLVYDRLRASVCVYVHV